MLIRLLGLALVMLLAVGCGSDDEPAALQGQLTYERGGGLQGRRDRLIVQPDGRASLNVFGKVRSIELTETELAELADVVERTDLGGIPSDATSPKPVPDAFGHRVVYEGRTVTTDDPAMPDQLRGLVGELAGLVDRYERR